MKIHDLFLLFQKERKHMAMVYNAHGTLLGLVTLEDVLEEIVGDIHDETDLAEKTLTIVNKTTIIASGEAEVTDINDMLKVKLKIDEHNTIATYLLENLHRSSGRIVQVTSLSMYLAREFNLDFLHSKMGFSPSSRYNLTNLYRSMFALELENKLKKTSISVATVHPGVTKSRQSRPYEVKKIKKSIVC